MAGLANAISESSAKALTETEHEKASEEPDDAKRFYSILFASVRSNVIDDDGFPTTRLVLAKIHPLFLPVLTANINSKATKTMQEAVESMAAELSTHEDQFTNASNIFPQMFDKPFTAALRMGQWEPKHTILNPDGIKSNIGLHPLTPPRTWSAAYKIRQE